jgi:hypothetical protein
MDYGMIGKREKAKRYAEQPNRFILNKFDVTFQGDNNSHHVTFDNGTFNCDCEFFMTHKRCAHTMALEINSITIFRLCIHFPDNHRACLDVNF